MPRDAEMFKDRLHGLPAPTNTDEDQCAADTIFEGGITTIAEKCKALLPYDNTPFDADEVCEPGCGEGGGFYHFKDGSKAGVRNNHGKWEVWIPALVTV